MKIGILTLPFNNNYGGILQSYALQTFLKKRGHDVTVIDRRWEKQRNGVVDGLKNIVKVISGISLYRLILNKLKSKEMTSFIYNRMSFTTKICSYIDFEKLRKYSFDSLIVGSDQVWRFDYTKERRFNYFLDFAKSWKIKKIAYAASFGTDELNIDNKSKKNISDLLSCFDLVSVREQSGVQICNEQFHVEAELMIDPTFLVSKEEYIKLAKNATKNEYGLLIYMLDFNKEKTDIIDFVSKEMDMKSFYIGLGPFLKKTMRKSVYPSIYNWLKGFENASFVVTDSFHGCVFSLIFNKPFLVVNNKERGMARFITLLSTFGLESQLISNITEINQTNLYKKIDFSSVNDKIHAFNNKSDSFFKKVGI